MVFACLLLACFVQRWIRNVQKCSLLTQLWLEMSELKSAGTALNMAENAKVSEKNGWISLRAQPGYSDTAKIYPKSDILLPPKMESGFYAFEKFSPKFIEFIVVISVQMIFQLYVWQFCSPPICDTFYESETCGNYCCWCGEENNLQGIVG